MMTFKARLRLRVWRLMPAEPPGIVPGQDEEMHHCAAAEIYDALKWVGNPDLVPEIVAGRMGTMFGRLKDSVKRTGEVR